MENEKELQQKVLVYQIMQQQIQQLHQQAQLIEKTFIEAEATKQAINDLKNANENAEIILSIGSGYFTHAKATNKDSILSEVGSGIVINSTYEEALENLETKKKELEEEAENVTKQITITANRIKEITNELEKAQK